MGVTSPVPEVVSTPASVRQPTMDRPRDRPRATGRTMAAVGAVVGSAAIWLFSLAPNLPPVSRDRIVVATVERGEILRVVQGGGVLQPEHERSVAAPVAAEVEAVLRHPGDELMLGDPILELANAEVERERLSAETSLARGRADLALARARTEGERLTHRSRLVELRSELSEAERRLAVDEALADQGLLSSLELERSRAAVAELTTRVEIESDREAVLIRSADATATALEAEVEGLAAVARFHRARANGLVLRSPIEGVLTDLTVDEGEWVEAGRAVARVVSPKRLRAVLRIPEAAMKAVEAGRPVTLTLPGHGETMGVVEGIDPAVEGGSVRVEVALPRGAPPGARPEARVNGRIELGRLSDVLVVDRPTGTREHETAELFRLVPGGNEAERVRVLLGAASARRIEVRAGLEAHDQIIVSDLGPDLRAAVRIRIE